MGKLIKKQRELLKLTQIDLAEKIGMNNSVLSRIEAGKRPVEDNELVLFSDFFGVKADYLLGRTNDPSSSNNIQSNNSEHDFHFYDTDGVQFIARSDKNLSPDAYRKMLELAKKAAELFDEDNED